MARENLSIHLAARPKGEIIPGGGDGATFEYRVTPAPTEADLKDGEILVESLYLSLDPAMRTWLNDARSYVPPVQIGELMRGGVAARVLASKSSKAKAGDYVYASSGWTEYAIVPESRFEPTSNFPGLQKPQHLLSGLGITGVTAWVGLELIGNLKAGQLVVVSGAAGATGSVAAQIAKIKGCRVVGICGSDDKCKWLTDELGLDVAVNYKAADFKDQFKKATDGYIDVYFDNVGGDILDLCLTRAKQHARFILCGAISGYNATERKGLQNYNNIISQRIRMEGFIVFDHLPLYPQARKELSQWMTEGKLKTSETIIKGGLKAADQGLVDLYKGINSGKLLVEIKPDETRSNL
jgi:NADPH-dependent curcumin reductase CurA